MCVLHKLFSVCAQQRPCQVGERRPSNHPPHIILFTVCLVQYVKQVLQHSIRQVVTLSLPPQPSQGYDGLP